MTESTQKKQPKLRTAYTAPEDAPEREEKARIFGLVRHLVDDMVVCAMLVWPWSRKLDAALSSASALCLAVLEAASLLRSAPAIA